jgi:hypothetical protein
VSFLREKADRGFVSWQSLHTFMPSGAVRPRHASQLPQFLHGLSCSFLGRFGFRKAAAISGRHSVHQACALPQDLMLYFPADAPPMTWPPSLDDLVILSVN